MSRSWHQSKSRDFILGKNTTKFKNKYKIPTDIEQQRDIKIYWKKKKHIAYGEQRSFMFRGQPTYAGETYCKNVGEYCTSVIEPAKERRKNKLKIEDVLNDILENQKSLEDKFSKVVDENFWELV